MLMFASFFIGLAVLGYYEENDNMYSYLEAVDTRYTKEWKYNPKQMKRTNQMCHTVAETLQITQVHF